MWLLVSVRNAAEAAAAPLTLGKFVPADVHMYAGGKDSPERNRLLAAYWRAFEKTDDERCGVTDFTANDK